MIRTLMAAAAVSGLMLSAALAQTSGSPNQGSATMSGAQRGDANAQVISQQAASQWLGSKLMGTDVIGPDNEKIGDVSDVLIDRAARSTPWWLAWADSAASEPRTSRCR